MILDVSNYLSSHPGGRALLEQNRGRDVSKYFYGGYSMSKASYPYAHSSAAVKVTHNLAIARIASTCNPENGAPNFKASLIARDEVVKKQVYTVTFGMEEREIGVQRYYADIDVIGRHFLVYHKDAPAKKRQYTVCNSLQKDTYNEYLKVIESYKVGGQKP